MRSETIEYGEEEGQAMDLFFPECGGRTPTLFFVHGGAWSSGDRSDYRSVGNFYSRNGYAVASVDHRKSPRVRHPSHIQDVARAFSWVKKNLDSERIHAFGHSSGAHLVSLLATNRRYLESEGCSTSDVSSVVAVSGIYRLGSNVQLAGYGHVFPTKEDKRDASPVNFVGPWNPKFLLMYAERDLITFSNQAKNFEKTLKGVGVEVACRVAAGENHSTILFDCVTPGGSGKMILEFMEKIE